MTDLISRADAIEAVASADETNGAVVRFSGREIIAILQDLPSAETHEIRTETHGVCLISKEDAMGAVQDHFNADGFKGYDDGQKMMDRINALPSADAEPKRVLQGYNKGANTIQTIRHEELTQIANTRKAVESADAVQGEWQIIGYDRDYVPIQYTCSVCGSKFLDEYNFCPDCGARMKGGDTE